MDCCTWPARSWGGEEFLALLPSSDADAARQVVERFRQAVAAVHVEVGGQLLTTTMSFGIAEFGDDMDLQAATVRADQALYSSKREGRNCVTVHAGAVARPAGAA